MALPGDPILAPRNPQESATIAQIRTRQNKTPIRSESVILERPPLPRGGKVGRGHTVWGERMAVSTVSSETNDLIGSRTRSGGRTMSFSGFTNRCVFTREPLLCPFFTIHCFEISIRLWFPSTRTLTPCFALFCPKELLLAFKRTIVFLHKHTFPQIFRGWLKFGSARRKFCSH